MTQPLADTRDYLVVHQCLRLTLDRFVSATERLDPAKLAEVLGERWALFARALHHHHEVEDVDFFPVIKSVRTESGTLIDRLASEHVDLVAKLDAVDRAVAALEANATSETKRAVHDAIAAVRDELFPHLDVEDGELLPIAAAAISDTEWKRLGDKAFKSVPKKDLPIIAGVMDEVVRSLPAERRPPPPPLIVRALIALSWRRRYAKFIEPLAT
jgi:hemerythrin-like domain-containing protein